MPSGRIKLRPTALFDPFLRLISLDRQFLVPGLIVYLVTPRPDQSIRASAFNHPCHDLPVGILNVDVKPGMGIDHVPLHHGAFQRHWFVDIEFSRKRMMRPHRERQRQRRATIVAIAASFSLVAFIEYPPYFFAASAAAFSVARAPARMFAGP